MTRTAEPIEARLRRNIIADEAGCWVWQGAKSASGYGRMAVPTGKMGGARDQAHRVAYRTWVGPIPEGLTIDHLCRNRACINPDHLEPVTLAVNVSRSSRSVANRTKTHCKFGHEFTPENTRLVPKGRRCKACERRRSSESGRTRRAEATD